MRTELAGHEERVLRWRSGAGKDRADGELVPRDARPVLVPLGVVHDRARDAAKDRMNSVVKTMSIMYAVAEGQRTR